MKEVMVKDQFGTCPHCHAQMLMLSSVYTLYGMTPSGKYPNSVMKQDKDYTMVCPKCNFKASMVQTMEGLFPRNHKKVKEDEFMMNQKPEDNKLIGYIDEDA